MAVDCAQKIPGVDLAAAIYIQLVAEMPTRNIYDDIPESATWPYITIGEAFSEDDSTKMSYGMRKVINFHVWTGLPNRGWEMCHMLINEVLGALVNNTWLQAAPVANWHLVDVVPGGNIIFLQEDNSVRHGVLPILFVLDQTA